MTNSCLILKYISYLEPDWDSLVIKNSSEVLVLKSNGTSGVLCSFPQLTSPKYSSITIEPITTWTTNSRKSETIIFIHQCHNNCGKGSLVIEVKWSRIWRTLHGTMLTINRINTVWEVPNLMLIIIIKLQCWHVSYSEVN